MIIPNIEELLAAKFDEVSEKLARILNNHDQHLLDFFEYNHLPLTLQDISIPFHVMAHSLVEHLPPHPERTMAIRKLLEAKDCAVRTQLAIQKKGKEPQ